MDIFLNKMEPNTIDSIVKSNKLIRTAYTLTCTTDRSNAQTSLQSNCCDVLSFKIDIDHVSKHFTDVTPKVSGTPTFIVMNKNDEVGRIVGYQNRDMFFWALSEYIPD